MLAHAPSWYSQETKFKDAIRYYQPLVARAAGQLLSLPAVLLANLCVAYIMTSQVHPKPYPCLADPNPLLSFVTPLSQTVDSGQVMPSQARQGCPVPAVMPGACFHTQCPLRTQNEEAEELMRQVEREEEAAAAAVANEPGETRPARAQQLHLCIINLVIGTLYCSKARMRVCVCVWGEGGGLEERGWKQVG